ncbi:MAG: 2-hydroxychromene-2-carboxylate isomerase [Burkholderiaceae bacterium]|jgi:2-hydroxychromene-2-carboxylate isomerase|nr:2-hydroxychromene-2-carboxylate isomerase [Burkholderiaceae bacterium]
MKPTKTVDYFMTPVSPYVYLGHDRLRALCARTGARINLVVMDLAKVFPVSGGVPLKDRAPQRQAYRLQELQRWRDHLGLPLNLQPAFFPVPPALASTLILAAQQRHGLDAALDLAGDCLRAVWAEERNIADAATLRAMATARGHDADALMSDAASDAIAARFAAGSQQAIDRGVFGAPTYALGETLFWGQDRLDFLERALND